jgi:hypothetical protein
LLGCFAKGFLKTPFEFNIWTEDIFVKTTSKDSSYYWSNPINLGERWNRIKFKERKTISSNNSEFIWVKLDSNCVMHKKKRAIGKEMRKYTKSTQIIK